MVCPRKMKKKGQSTFSICTVYFARGRDFDGRKKSSRKSSVNAGRYFGFPKPSKLYLNPGQRLCRLIPTTRPRGQKWSVAAPKLREGAAMERHRLQPGNSQDHRKNTRGGDPFWKCGGQAPLYGS